MVIYIKEMDKNDKLGEIDKFPKFIQKIIIKIVDITNNFFIVNIDESTKKYILPNSNKEKVYNKIIKKISKEQESNKRKIRIVLSKKISKFKKKMQQLKIIDGNKILLENLDKIIEKVLGIIPIEIAEIYILANNYSQENVSFIKSIAMKVKSISIITKQINKYKILEEILLENGIIISVLNNKKKSLKKAKIIINLDFAKEDIKKYNLYRNACIIDLNDKIIINDLQGFDGIIIKDADIKILDEDLEFFKFNNLIDDFRKTELYQTIETKNRNIEILSLYGNNGKINEKELLNIQKDIDKIEKLD